MKNIILFLTLCWTLSFYGSDRESDKTITYQERQRFCQAITEDNLSEILCMLYAEERYPEALASLFYDATHPLSFALRNKGEKRFCIINVLTNFEKTFSSEMLKTRVSSYDPATDSPLIRAAATGDEDAVTHFTTKPYFLDIAFLKKVTCDALFHSLTLDEKTLPFPSDTTNKIYNALLKTLTDTPQQAEENLKKLLHQSVRNGSLFQLNFFLSQGVPIQKNEPELENLLVDEKSKENDQILRCLLMAGMTLQNYENYRHRFLYRAAKAKKEQLVAYFLSLPSDSHTYTFNYYSSVRGKEGLQQEVTAVLLDTTSPSNDDKNFHSFYRRPYYTIKTSSLRRLLLKNLTSPPTHTHNPLLDPLLYDDPSFIEYLLQKNGYNYQSEVFDVIWPKGDSWHYYTTPTHTAAQCNRSDILELLKRYNIPLDQPDWRNRTPLLNALCENATQAALFLIAHGASVIKTAHIEGSTYPELTLLEIATKYLNKGIVPTLAHHKDITTKMKLAALCRAIDKDTKALEEEEKKDRISIIDALLESIPPATPPHHTGDLRLFVYRKCVTAQDYDLQIIKKCLDRRIIIGNSLEYEAELATALTVFEHPASLPEEKKEAHAFALRACGASSWVIKSESYDLIANK